MEPGYWDSVRECRELIDKLALRAEQWIKREPEIDGLLELQNRAGVWLSRLHPERPGLERRAARAASLRPSVLQIHESLAGEGELRSRSARKVRGAIYRSHS